MKDAYMKTGEGGGASRLFRGNLPYVLIPLLTFLLLSSVLRNGFVNWDDDFTLQLNTLYRGFSWTHLKWMFTTFHMGHYQPLSWLTFAADYKLWGMDPMGYHLTSLLLHSANAGLFYYISRKLFERALPQAAPWQAALAAAFSALFFSLHPLRVESVAWATERRDVLSGFFLFLTVAVYLRSAAGGGRLSPRALAAACFIYLLSLLSKGIGVTLPAVLLILDVYPLRRLPADLSKWGGRELRPVLLEKVPFAVLSLIAGLTGLVAQVSTGATGFLNIGEAPSLGVRTAQALYASAFYIWKTIVPSGLLPLYERPYQAGWPPMYVMAGAAAALAATAAVIVLRRRLPGLAAAWVAYFAMLVPVAQLVPFGPYLAADRYTYVPCLPLALLAGWSFYRSIARFNLKRAAAAACVLLLGLGLLSRIQSRIWLNPETLWRHILSVNPYSSIAHSNLGSILLDSRGKVEEAAAHFREAIRIRPDYPFGNYNYGNALSAQGRLDEALDYYRRAVRLMPDFANARFNLANTLLHKGRVPEAVSEYRETLRLDPAYANAHNNLAVALLSRGELPAARRHLEEALRLNPAHEAARATLSRMAELPGGGK